LRSLLWGCVGGEAFELEQHGGHRLADLVVQTAREPLALLFLGLQGTRTSIPPLRLQPLQHPVVRPLERADLTGVGGRQALTAKENIGGVHPLGKPLQRQEQATEEEAVHHQHHHQPEYQAAQIDQRPVFRQRPRNERQSQRTCNQDRRVRREHAPKQGHASEPRS